MKLFAWQPKGFGQLSFFVCAENEEIARIAVDQEIARLKTISKDNFDAIDEYDAIGWGTDYYELTVVDPGVVVTNDNY